MTKHHLIVSIATTLTLAACEAPLEPGAMEGPSAPAHQLMVDDDGNLAEVVDIALDDFKELADAYDLWDVPLDEQGLPIEVAMPLSLSSRLLSSTCAMASALSANKVASATLAWLKTKRASCFGYHQYPGDSESDCYIKYTAYAQKDAYGYFPGNACAMTASWWYDNHIQANFDASKNVYLRVDAKWCRFSNCEDGFALK